MSIFTPRMDYTGTDTLDFYTTADPYYTMWEWWYNPDTQQTEYVYDGMPNCVAYAYGRWNELANQHNLNSDWPIGSGIDWWYDAPGKGLSTGQTPQLGAAMVWGYFDVDPISGYDGHVAIVEKIEYDSNNNPIYVTCSNSAWNSYQPPRYPQNDFPWFYLSKFSTSDYDRDIIDVPSGVRVGTFMGFVYHPNFPQNSNPLLINQLIPVLTSGKKTITYYIGRRK